MNTIPGYDIVHKLGQGGMAEVYEAVDIRTKHHVALKFLLPQHTSDPAARTRFIREAKTGMQLNHPNIVKVLDTGEHNGQPYIVMELIRGKTLNTIMRKKKLPLSWIIAIGQQIADALVAAHKLGIVHRDISPRNIMLYKNKVKVMDFGLAKVMDTTTLTSDHAILGTFYYMSPEQAVGDAIDSRSDIFSLGVLLYQMLTGRQPFRGEHAGAIIHALLYTEPARICDIDQELPSEVEQVVFKALQKKPDNRYQSALDMESDLWKLDEVLSGKTVTLIASDITLEEVFEKHRGIYSALIGRDRELQHLQGYMTKMLNGKGSAVFVSGEAGIGKSRLAWELGHDAKKRGVRYLMGKCVQHTGIPYQPIVESLRQYFADKGVHDTRTLEKYLRNQTRHLRYRKDIVAALVLRQSFKDLNIINKEQLWDTVSEIIKMIAEDRPAVMHFDDLHWADAQTLDMLTSITQSIVDTRVLVIGTFRPEDIAEKKHPLQRLLKRKETKTLFHEIPLHRLDRTGTKNIITSVFENFRFTKDFAESIYQETEGNPLFILEVLKLLRDENIITRHNGGWRLASDSVEIHIPRTVTEVINRRIQKLSKDERELIELAAVDGVSFNSDTVIHCLAQPRVTILRNLQNLESSHNLIHATKHGYQFDHVKIKDVIYDGLIPELRKEYHNIIVAYMEEHFGDQDEYAGRIAYHLINTGRRSDAVPFLLNAGQHSFRLFANDESLDHINKAIHFLELYGKQKTTKEKQSITWELYYLRGDLKLRLAMVQDSINDHKQAIRIARSLGAKKELALALAAVGNVIINIGQYKESNEFNKRALRALKKHPDKIAEAYILPIMAKAYFFLHDHAKAVQLSKKAYKIGVQEKSDLTKERSLWVMGAAYYWWGRFDEAIKISKQALTLARRNEDLNIVGYTNNMIGLTYMVTGDIRKAYHYLMRSKRILERIGEKMYLGNVIDNLGDIFLHLADHKKALSYFENALAMTSISGDVWIKRDVLTGIGSVHADQAEYEQALHNIQTACREKKHEGLHVIYELNHLCMLWLDIGAERKALQTCKEIESEFSKKKTKFLRPDAIFDDTNRYLRTGLKYYLKQNFNAAARSLYKALPRVKKSRRFASLIHTYMFIIKTEFARGNYQQAGKIAKEFLSYAMRTGCRKYIAQGHLLLAQVFFVKKRYAQARKAAVKCRAICKRYNLMELYWQAHYISGKIAIAQKQFKKAWKDLAAAEDIIDTISTKLSNSLKKIYVARHEIKDLKREIKVLKEKGIYG